jgi:hypothetical protein
MDGDAAAAGEIKRSGGEVRVNHRANPAVDNCWSPVTQVILEGAGNVTVVISNEGADGHVDADAVRLPPAR